MEMKTRWQQGEDIGKVGAGRIDLRNTRYFPHGAASSMSFRENAIDEEKKNLEKAGEHLELSGRA